MLALLCSIGIGSCSYAVNGGMVMTHNGTVVQETNTTIIRTVPPAPVVSDFIVVAQAPQGLIVDVSYPAGTPYYAPVLSNKFSD